MSERPSRGGPRPYYGHVAGSEDDSNNGNDSIEESEVETQLSISSESSIEYHDEDSDDHEGTGVDDAIELLSPPDENEGEDAIVGEDSKTQVRQSLLLRSSGIPLLLFVLLLLALLLLLFKWRHDRGYGRVCRHPGSISFWFVGFSNRFTH